VGDGQAAMESISRSDVARRALIRERQRQQAEESHAGDSDPVLMWDTTIFQIFEANSWAKIPTKSKQRLDNSS
jgi:hypothetical protein